MNLVTLRLNCRGNMQYQQMPCHLDAHLFPSFTFEWLNCHFADLLRMINVTYCSKYPYICQPGYRWKRGTVARQIHPSLIAAVVWHRGYSSGYTGMSIRTVRNHLQDQAYETFVHLVDSHLCHTMIVHISIGIASGSPWQSNGNLQCSMTKSCSISCKWM